MITAGYMAMLLCMTYNIEVILAVVIGLTISNMIVYLVRTRDEEVNGSVAEEESFGYCPSAD